MKRKAVFFLCLFSLMVVMGCALTSGAQESGLNASSDVELSEAGITATSPAKTAKAVITSEKTSTPENDEIVETKESDTGVTPTAKNAAEKTTATATVVKDATVPTAQISTNKKPDNTGYMFGVEVSVGDADASIEHVKQAGSTWVRSNALIWSDVESVEGNRDWSAAASVEQDILLTSSLGMETILIVRGTPAWAQKNDGYKCGPILPEKLTAFSNFIHDAVQRYSVPPYNVKYWEIWNEPDVPSTVDPGSPYGCMGDPGLEYYGGSEYAQILKTIYPVVKSVDKDAQVLVGGLLMDCDPVNPPETTVGSGRAKDCSPSTFLEGVLAHASDSFDGISFHAYDYYQGSLGQYGNSNWWSAWNTTGPVMIAKVQYLKNLLQQYGVTNKMLFNTEMALVCGSTGEEAACQTDDFNKTKAYYAAQSYGATMANGVDASLWYSYTGWRASGLVNADKSTRPVFDAFHFASQKMDGASYVGEVDEFTGVMGYEFTQDGRRIWLVWSLDGDEHPVNLSSMPSAIYSVLGEDQTAAQDITVGIAPVYIEWSE